MLFRTGEGNLIEIKKHNYKKDTFYFEKLMEIQNLTPKLEKTFYNKNCQNSNK